MISVEEVLVTVLLIGWVVFVMTILTKALYDKMRRRGVEHEVAVYYNRKIIHLLAGGVCAAAVPFFFQTPILPVMVAMLMAIFAFTAHKMKRLMYWFQTEKNRYEVSFCIMWAAIIVMG